MKLLTLQDLNGEDSLALYWKGTFDPQLEVELRVPIDPEHRFRRKVSSDSEAR